MITLYLQRAIYIIQENEEIKNACFEIIELPELETGLLELANVIALIDDIPAKRTAPKQVIENTPEKFPILKSVRDHPRKVRDSETPDARLKQREIKAAFDITYLFTFSDSDRLRK